MKKVLIVNLDQEDRIAYSVLVAASLFQVNSDTRISMLCSAGADVLKSIGIFESVYEISSSEAGEKSLIKKHPGVFNENWDFVFNHSSELSSAALISMLKSDESFGPVLKDQKIGNNLSHQSFFSYMLTELNGRKAPCHISQIYFDIVNLQYNGKKLPSIWSDKELHEIKAKFEELRANFLKKRIILIDAGISKVNNLSDLNFLIQMVKTLDASTHYHPVIFSKAENDDSFIINKIREAVSEELTIATVSDEGLLSLVASVDMVITDNITLKSYSDLALTPSLLLNRKEQLPLMDFSMISGSMLFQCSEFNSKSPEAIFQICKFMSGDATENQLASYRDVYKTVWQGNRVSLAPVSADALNEYYKWVLCNRFLLHLEKQELPDLYSNEAAYSSLIATQKAAIRSTFNVLLEKAKTMDKSEAIDPLLKTGTGNNSELFLLALDYLQYQQAEPLSTLKKFLAKSKPVIQDLMNFLNSEETRFSQKSIAMTE